MPAIKNVVQVAEIHIFTWFLLIFPKHFASSTSVTEAIWLQMAFATATFTATALELHVKKTKSVVQFRGTVIPKMDYCCVKFIIFLMFVFGYE